MSICFLASSVERLDSKLNGVALLGDGFSFGRDACRARVLRGRVGNRKFSGYRKVGLSVFHAHALVNSHDRLRAVSPIDETD